MPEISPSCLSLRQRLSEGAFGTVYVAEARGVPDYGGDRADNNTKLVAVKFLADTATEQEK